MLFLELSSRFFQAYLNCISSIPLAGVERRRQEAGETRFLRALNQEIELDS